MFTLTGIRKDIADAFGFWSLIHVRNTWFLPLFFEWIFFINNCAPTILFSFGVEEVLFTKTRHTIGQLTLDWSMAILPTTMLMQATATSFSNRPLYWMEELGTLVVRFDLMA